jgi:anti-anti-sigma regulatory factor
MHEAVNTQTATVAIVPVIGEHDLSGYEPLKAVLARAAIQAPNVIVDLSHCDFIDGRRCDRIAARCTQRRRSRRG